MDARALRALLLPLTILAWLAVVVIVGWLLQHVARTLLMVVLALVIAFAMAPAVNLLARYIPRTVALAVTYLLAFVVLVGAVGAIAATLAGQVSNLVHNVPEYASAAQGAEPHLAVFLSPLGVTQEQLDGLRTQLTARLEAIGGTVASDALGFVRTFLNGVLDAVLVLMLSIYFVANGPRVRAWLQEQTPASHRGRVRILTAIVNQVVGGYVRGTLTMAVLIGVLVGAGMGVLQVRYALLLGVLAFFMEFVPILGTLISGAVCVLVALFQGWVLALIVLGYFVVVHVIEGDVVGPRVMGRAIGIHPAVALVALLAGTELFGLWGALFGAPLAGLIQAFVTVAWREIRGGAPALVAAAATAPSEPARRPRRSR